MLLQHSLRYRHPENKVFGAANEQKWCPIRLIPDYLTITSAMEARQSTLPQDMCGARDTELFVFCLIEFIGEDEIKLTGRQRNDAVVVKWIC
jgi:hypothetical protein